MLQNKNSYGVFNQRTEGEGKGFNEGERRGGEGGRQKLSWEGLWPPPFPSHPLLNFEPNKIDFKKYLPSPPVKHY